MASNERTGECMAHNERRSECIAHNERRSECISHNERRSECIARNERGVVSLHVTMLHNLPPRPECAVVRPCILILRLSPVRNMHLAHGALMPFLLMYMA